jgi:hypothetical protein
MVPPGFDETIFDQAPVVGRELEGTARAGFVCREIPVT